ncbi:MAG TPA: hypothetical protein VMQ81_09230 [Acidimicrobiia bacterium]|nr:hypothetical protein [Acidimicrobiia bacterium]
MELQEFTKALGRMSATDLHEVAAVLYSHSDSAADEVDAWRVTISIDHALRRARLTRVAARAASSATHAVLRSAESQGIALPDAEVTHVARAAAEVARGMVAGADAEGEVRLLLGNWTPLVGAAA